MSEAKEERKILYFAELDAARKAISEHEISEVLNEEAKQKLVESVSLLNSFFNSPGAMRGVVEVEGNDIRHITDNSITAEFFGRTQESMSNTLASQMGVDQEFIDIWIKHYEESKNKKQQVNFEYEHKAEKRSRFFAVTVNYLGESTRGFSRYTYVLFDITEQKQAQKALQRAHDELDRRVEQRTAELVQSNEQLKQEVEERKRVERELNESRRLLEEAQALVHLGSWEWDILTNANSWSDEMFRIFGHEPGSVVPNYDFFSEALHPDDRDRVLAAVHRTVELSVPYAEEYRIIRPDGSERIVYANGVVHSDEQGQAERVVGAVLDITEKKNLEDRLQHALKMEAIGTLAGGVAHDFNNLLMGMLGNISLISHDLERSHPHRERLKNVEELVQSGSKLTNQLLGFARKGKYEVKPINLNKIVKESSEAFGRTRKEISIKHELAENLLQVEADENQILQTLFNLYINAADSMLGGGNLFLQTMNVTHVEMKKKQYDPKPGNYVMITVTDQGVGMDEKTLERVFDPFFTTKEMGRGTGLGLASAYGIIKGHGGYIDVDSKKGYGTTFNIYLPASDEKIAEALAVSERVEKGSETILLVDDEDMVLNVGVRMLEKMGYVVLKTKSGQEAIEIYEENHDQIDLVILDMIMPGIGGGETFDKMKEINPEVTVLLASGYSIEGRAQEILDRGCSGFIQKPFNLEDLSQKIREILDKD